MKFMLLVDVEGVTGVTNYPQAESSELGIDMLMNDLNALIEGILTVPGNSVTVYEQHTDGCNIRLEELPAEVAVIRGKPPEYISWPFTGFDGLIMLGFHARAGVTNALLAHSYMPWNLDIRLNGISHGEIGIETAMAGERSIPLMLVTGDSEGIREARELVPGVAAVTVKESLGDTQALCYPPARTRQLMLEAGRALSENIPEANLYIVSSPVTLEVDLDNCEYLKRFSEKYPKLVNGSTVKLHGETVTEVWTEYLKKEEIIKREIQ